MHGMENVELVSLCLSVSTEIHWTNFHEILRFENFHEIHGYRWRNFHEILRSRIFMKYTAITGRIFMKFYV